MPLILLIARVSSHTVLLTWNPSPSPDIAYYNVMRQFQCAGAWERHGKTPQTSFLDGKVSDTKTYCYEVTATNKAKQTSNPSNVVTAVIP